MNDQPTVAAAIPARKEIYTARSWPPTTARKLTLRASADGTLGEAPGVAGAPSFAGDPGGFLFTTTGNLTFSRRRSTRTRSCSACRSSRSRAR